MKTPADYDLLPFVCILCAIETRDKRIPTRIDSSHRRQLMVRRLRANALIIHRLLRRWSSVNTGSCARAASGINQIETSSHTKRQEETTQERRNSLRRIISHTIRSYHACKLRSLSISNGVAWFQIALHSTVKRGSIGPFFNISWIKNHDIIKSVNSCVKIVTVWKKAVQRVLY